MNSLWGSRALPLKGAATEDRFGETSNIGGVSDTVVPESNGLDPAAYAARLTFDADRGFKREAAPIIRSTGLQQMPRLDF